MNKLSVAQLKQLAYARRRPIARKLTTISPLLVSRLLRYCHENRDKNILAEALINRQSRAVPTDKDKGWSKSYRQIALQALRAGGDPNIREDHITPISKALNLIEALQELESVLGQICRTRISVLKPFGTIAEHIDDPQQQRVIAVLQGEQDFRVRTKVAVKKVDMQIGELWFVNTAWWHSVSNPGDRPRVALLSDLISPVQRLDKKGQDKS